MYCEQCGTKLEEGAEACPGCSSPEDAAARSGTAGPEAESDAARKQIVRAVLILVLVAAIGVIAYNLFWAAKPITTVKKFVSAINERDFDKFSACIDPDFREKFAADETMFTDTFKYMTLKIIKVDSQEKTDQGVKITAEVEVKLTDSEEKAQSGPLIFQLRKTSRGWFITDLES